MIHLAAISINCMEIGACSNHSGTIWSGLANIAQLLLSVAGSLAVIFLLWGGLKYVISRGDPSHIKAAKETIMYAIVGIIVVIIAYAAVAFVANQLG